MKLHFEANLDYQHAAIESVCDLFRGQEICRTEFTVTRGMRLRACLELGLGPPLRRSDCKRSWHRQPADAARR